MKKNVKRIIGLMLILLISMSVLVACGTNDSDELADEEVQGEELVAEEEEVEEKEVDENGMVHESSLDLKYAKSFTVDYFEGGYKIIEDWTGRKTILIPEGKEVPELKEEMDIVQMPINSVGAFSTVNVTHLRPLGEIDKVSLVTRDSGWHIPEITEGLEDGSIVFVGKNSAPDYEKIQEVNPDIIFITTGTSHGGDETTLKLDEMGIKWIGHSSHREEDPRGRLEWVKFAAVLLDKEAEAEEFYDEQVARIDDVVEKASQIPEDEKITVATTFMSGDTFYARNAGDYEVKLYEMAGGKYILEDMNPDETGNTKMSAEEFYAEIEDVDLFIYNTAMGADTKTKEDVLALADYFKDIKAVENNNLWGIKDPYFQSADHVADMIEDLYEIFTAEPGTIKDTEYYFLLED